MSITRLALIQGPSAVGKTTACALNDWRWLRTVTARPRRANESAAAYYFVTPEQFAASDEAGLLCERTEYVGNGTPYGIYWSDLEAALTTGGLWYCITDSRAAAQLRPLVPELVSIGLVASPQILRKRMQGRGDSQDEITRRLARYDEEVAAGAACDVQIDVGHMTPVEMAAALRMLARSLVPQRKQPIKTVYVSGPYSADPERYYGMALEVGNRLMERGYTPEIPHLTHEWDKRHPRPYDSWIEYDLVRQGLNDCTLRFSADPSPGAEIERRHAQEIGQPWYPSEEIFYLAASGARPGV